MRVLVAPDSFKGSLSARDVADAIRRGVLSAVPGAEVDCCALSDGGEGFASVLRSARGGVEHSLVVADALGEPVRAAWVMLGDGKTAIVESGAAIGLAQLPSERRRATATTTAGVGELVRDALAAGATRIVVGLGGSATTDGGAGMAQSLGVVFDGAPTPVTGATLPAIRAIDASLREPKLGAVEVVAATDVDNPLTGPEGAAHAYGPQKGARREEVALLDAALTHLVRITGDPGRAPGDGAAGGLGYGLRVFLGARRASGIEFVLEQCDFDARLSRADLVLTGEGRLDGQTPHGKVVDGVTARCRARGVPVIALVGAVATGAETMYGRGLTSYFSLCDRPMSEQEAIASAPALLESLAGNVARVWASRPPSFQAELEANCCQSSNS